MIRACLLLLLLIGGVDVLAAESGIPALTLTTNNDGSQEYSVTLQILFLMSALTVLPALIIMLTSFTRITIVLGILRRAIGLQQTPSNQVLIGLALFLTIFTMAPVLERINASAVQPYLENQMQFMPAVYAAEAPLREFMLGQTRQNDLELFVRLSKRPVAELEDVSFWVLVPAFVTSELKTAFQIGFLLFIPFLVIDMVIASLLMAMGMMMLSPLIISLPFKIMLFVMVDGWALTIGTLAGSFGM
ncbi:MAG: flagellar type III secretion system pore protein FliP [Gammaproteobacteria bacterium]|nr:flagellar type III secretion system pore protein FliP [Gammaproteobacteria bacterium]NNJ72980.1 flagellar type III secretion system pore protein FliP [Enterobacterales bacterium]